MNELHNEKSWNEFIRLRELVAGFPNDITLLKEELFDNYYQQILNGVADVKRHMSDKEIYFFFGKEAKKLRGYHTIKFSKRHLLIKCVSTNKVDNYEIRFCDGNLTLTHVSSES